MEAILTLEDGQVYRGRGFGASGERAGEVVFNTSLFGYQEILTDPSYAGQIIILTYPHIGNYGTNPTDVESARAFAEGLVVRELSQRSSNWRASEEISEYLVRNNVPAISHIDTRALVRRLRQFGSMRGVLSTADQNVERLVARAKASPSMVGRDLASGVTTRAPYNWNEPSSRIFVGATGSSPAGGTSETRFRVVAYDFGIKQNILRQLVDRGCSLTVVPASTSADDVLARKPDGVFLSNGPGDPEPLEYAAQNIRKLIGQVPIFGICLGHQVLGLALGGKTFKLKFGHHGGNHPVMNLATRKIEITAQNHGFVVDPDSLKVSEIELTHMNLNDYTLEGFKHKSLPLFGVQYHPEASPGPHDSQYLFDDFLALMRQFSKSV